MTKISYEQFLVLLSKYEKFNSKILYFLYDEFGKNIINEYFERYFESISKNDIDSFITKYSAYFDENIIELDEKIIDEYDSNGIVNMIVHRAYKYSLMSNELEKELAVILKESKNKLSIVNNFDNLLALYPELDIVKLFLSVKSSDDLEKLRFLIKIPYSYDDNSILKKEIPFIKRYLKICNNGVLDKKTLIKEFPNLCFDNVEGVDNLEEQIDLLNKLIYAKFNFYNRNIRLVIAYAKRFCKDFSFEDKLQEGCISLIKAINKFDISMDCKFSTFATTIIVQSICRYVANNNCVIRKPVYVYDYINKYAKFVTNYVSIHGVEPTIRECVEALGFSEKMVKKIQFDSLDVLSLNTSFKTYSNGDEIDFDFSDNSVSVEDELVSRDVVEVIKKVIYDSFDGKKREILLHRLGLDGASKIMTLESLGAHYGITREAVRQIEVRSKERLTRKLKNKGIDY